MPIYAYACAACGHELETLQKISEPVLTECPECNQDELRKQLTAPVFRLKGGGWYETDFKKDGKRNLADGPGGDTPKADSKPDSKADTKSDTKSESKSETKKSESKSDAKPATGGGTKKTSAPAA